MKLKHLFYYCGPNRRSDQTMIEACFGFDDADTDIILQGWESAMDFIQSELAVTGNVPKGPLPGRRQLPAEPFRGVSLLFCEVALFLQQSSGHQVQLSECREAHQPDCWLALFEHEETSVGEQAALLALQLFDQAWPALQISRPGRDTTQNFGQMFPPFSSRARALVQPAETAAIVAAATRAGVPVIKLERDPYDPVQGDFRIRMNSMLMLGHCARRQIIDGCFALEKSGPAAALLRDRLQIMAAARQLGMPVPRMTSHALNSTQSALLAARDIGYPLILRPRLREALETGGLPAHDAAQLEQAVHRAQAAGVEFVLEPWIAGNTWVFLVVNHQLLGVTDASTGRLYGGQVHEHFVSLGISASRSLNVGVLAMSVVSHNLSLSAAETGAVITDLQVAPRLDDLLSKEPAMLGKAAEEFVRWLVPSASGSAIPVVAVTGTNGKTSTSRMIDHVLRHAGRRTGLQCTDGRYVNGRLVDAGDNSSLMGHYRVFEDKSLDTAVLETHHRGIAVYGFAFDRCDVAVCTNVSDDHINTLGIETVKDMAVLKRSLLERARDCAILNADDPNCLAMIPYISSRRICLTSLHKGPGELSSLGTGEFYCLLKKVDGREWVVIHEPDQETEIIPVTEIPATFNGLARFNVSNAMQSIAACHALGISLQDIRSAMKLFVMSVENTPGRQNFYQGLPFQVLVDFAHNPDGMRRISEFTDGIRVKGRKIVAFSGFRQDPTVLGIANQIAGHFDHYVIKNYAIPEGKEIDEYEDPWRIPNLVKAVLTEKGIDDNRISVELDEMTAVAQTLEMAAEGDLVVLLLGYAVMRVIDDFMREYITSQAKKNPAGNPAGPVVHDPV